VKAVAIDHLLKRGRARQALHAARPYRAGEIVLDFAEVEWRPFRGRDTVQHPDSGHIYHPLLAAVAHSCDPNCEIDVRGRLLIAKRPIVTGEAITYDYETCESRLAYPFDCDCGSCRCRRRIG
jgi:hypothetical protein